MVERVQQTKKQQAPHTLHHTLEEDINLQEQQAPLDQAMVGYDTVASSLPITPQRVIALQSLVGNRKTIQLLRNHPSIQRSPIMSRRLGLVSTQIQREPHALEGIASTDPTVKPSQPLSPGGKLTPVYAQAWEVAWQEFKPKVDNIAGRLDGATAKVAPLKGRARAKEKAGTDYGGDTAGLVDIARASIVCKTADEVMEAWGFVNEEFNVVRVKNRFANPSSGYRDLMLNVELSSGHIAELQLHLKAIIDVKNGAGHKLYERVRVLEALENPTDEEKAELADKKQQMESLYNEAWEQAKQIPDK